MFTESYNLHFRQEENLEYVDFSQEIPENEQYSKIKLNYKMALDQIYDLSQKPEYKKYFYRLLQENQNPEESSLLDGNEEATVLGGALDKTLGKIFVILREQNNGNASILEWSQNNWKEIDSFLEKNKINNRFDRTINMGYNSTYHNYTWEYPLNREYSDESSHEKCLTSLTYSNPVINAKKWYVPIEESNRGSIFKIDKHRCFTIGYEEIKNRLNNFTKLKKAAEL